MGKIMISEFHFQKYYGPFMEHIKRHFPGSKIAGSVFQGKFRKPRDVIDFAYDYIANQYNGQRLVRIARFSEVIGLDGIIDLREIPEGVAVKRETRTKKERGGRPQNYTVLVAYGLKKVPTNQMVIVAEPVSGKRIHAFSTIYPGSYAPDFSDTKFWREHAFVKERRG